MKKVYCSIITIGDELLIGQTLDTNSAWMARELNQAGFLLRRRVAVGDDREAIVQALDQESGVCEIVLITGGLGPTSDDITKQVLADFFGSRLVVNEEVARKLTVWFSSRNLPILESNMLQAEVPDNCVVIPNALGSASGMWFERNDRVFVSMPGVPMEMKGMMSSEILPRLKSRFETPEIYHRTLITSGQGESFVAERLKDFENQLPKGLKLAYLPSPGFLKLRLSGLSSDLPGMDQIMEQHFLRMGELLADIRVAWEDIPIAELALRLLKEKGATLATAESCTGGYIAHLITEVPGSSVSFKGSVIAYSNEIKTGNLGVDPQTLERWGAVSEETVKGMAEGALRALGTDYSVSSSGIMGPAGGTAEKPVGTVWLAAAGPGKCVARKFNLRYSREENIRIAAFHGLNLLVKLLLGQAG